MQRNVPVIGWWVSGMVYGIGLGYVLAQLLT